MIKPESSIIGVEDLPPSSTAQTMANASDININFKKTEEGGSATTPALIQKNAIDIDPSALHEACKENDVASVKELLQRLPAAALAEKDDGGFTPLHTAAERGFMTIGRLLLENMPSRAMCAQDDLGNTPLHLACYRGGADFVAMLLEYLPPHALQIKNGDGQLPINIAVANNQASTVRLLWPGSDPSHKIREEDLKSFLGLGTEDPDGAISRAPGETTAVSPTLSTGSNRLQQYYSDTSVHSAPNNLQQPYLSTGSVDVAGGTEPLGTPLEKRSSPEASASSSWRQTSKSATTTAASHSPYECASSSSRSSTNAAAPVTTSASRIHTVGSVPSRNPIDESSQQGPHMTFNTRPIEQRKAPKQPSKLQRKWDEIINLVIRPRRHVYTLEELGPKKFTMQGKTFERTDLEIPNQSGLMLQCSWFQPIKEQRPATKMACVIVLHGNAGSRCFSLEMVKHIVPYGLTLFCFDFSGSGLSDGDYVSLGYWEKYDLDAVVSYLHRTGTVSRLGLWGRSMGAVTALMYGAEHPVAAICADSPFASLIQVMVDLVKSRKSWVPEAAIGLASRQIRKTIKKRARFDIKELNTVEFARRCMAPCILAHAEGDDFILMSHHEMLASVYAGDYQAIRMQGDHGSARPASFYRTVKEFFIIHLTPNSPLAREFKWKPTKVGTTAPVADMKNNMCADCIIS